MLTFWEAPEEVFNAIVVMGTCHIQHTGSAVGLSDFPREGGWGNSWLRGVSSTLGAVRGSGVTCCLAFLGHRTEGVPHSSDNCIFAVPQQ